LAQPQELCI